MIVSLSDEHPEDLADSLDDLMSQVHTPADALVLAQTATIVNAAFVDHILSIYGRPESRSEVVRIVTSAVALGEQ